MSVWDKHLLGQAYNFLKPDPIDENKVYNMAKSPVMDEMHQEATKLMQDPSQTAIYRNKLNMEKQNISDAMFNQNILSGRATAANPNANPNQVAQQNEGMFSKLWSGVSDTMSNFATGLYDKGMGLLDKVGSMDMQARNAMANAYGQNTTNQNNFKTSMFNMGMQGAAMLACDAKLKENIKPIGKAKTKNGNIVNLYNYNYKGRKKKHTGVIAQDVMRVEPGAVKEGKNKLLYVNMTELFS